MIFGVRSVIELKKDLIVNGTIKTFESQYRVLQDGVTDFRDKEIPKVDSK